MKALLEKIHLPNWLVGILALIFILRVPSFFEPYHYGDEMIYLTLGQGIRQGMSLYSEIYDNKPPLLYLVAAVSENLFWFKAILTFWNMFTIVIFWKLTEILFKEKSGAQKISTLIFAPLTTLPLLEGMTVNAELFMILPALLAFYLLLVKETKPKTLILSGFLFGIAALFKLPAAFDLPVIIVFWLVTSGPKNWGRILKKTFYLAGGFIFPILLTSFWYYANGALAEYIKAIFSQNVGYLSSFRPDDVQKPFLIRNVPLFVRVLLVLSGISTLSLFRKKISQKFIFVCLWLFFSLFAATLSERPYPHYLIQSAAPIAILLGIFFADKSLEQSLTVIPLALALFVPTYYRYYHYKTLFYYERFINFTTGRMSKDAYLNSFSPNVKRNYQIAEFLTQSSLPKEKVFMWDNNSPTVYALSRRLPPTRFVADYHINDYSSRTELAIELIKNKPKFIILTSKYPFPEIQPLIGENYLLIQQIEDSEIWSRVNSK